MSTPNIDEAEQVAAFLAWKRGDPTEYWAVDRWLPLKEHVSIHTGITLRRKPAPKLRAWKADEAPLGAWYLHESGGLPWLADRLYPAGVRFAGNETLFSYDQLVLQFRHTTDGAKTWLPCGVVENT